ncbi:hypothetical protein IAG25_25410 [Caballeronia sp. EK]|uniref:hypothetical protein n=1 Tax=Caballeronia sp. EK TaxID=2767469 RepID=UPI001655A765|nr:hypothetical protein [Caballeronia sp. EK]MBC8640173.1 hypothetical protein [Caballeronia sp. EK]
MEMEEQANFDTKVIELENPARRVEIARWSALQGWDMRAAAIDYAVTDVRDRKMDFTMEVLRDATVDGKPLDSREAVDALLVRWQDLKRVFDEVLAFNDVDIEVKEYVSAEVSAMGVKMAIAMGMHFEQMAVLGKIAAEGDKA